MRILCLSNGVLDENLGAGYVVVNFARELSEKGHQVTLLDPLDYGLWGQWPRARQYGIAVGIAIRVVVAIAKNNIDLIEIYGGEGWLAIWIAKKILKVHVPLVSHSNGIESHVIFYEKYWRKKGIDWNPRSLFQPSQSWLFDIGFRNADALIVVSEFERNFAIDQCYQPKDRVVRIESGLPNVFLNRRASEDRDNTILYCGGWIERKNVRLIVTDVTRFLKKYTDWSLIIVGGKENTIKPNFPRDIQGRVKILSPMPRRDLIHIYERSPILVFPSFYESFGLVAAEAMSCGCAVITSRVGLGANLEHLNQAYILDDPVSPNLYEAIVRLVVDKNLRQTIAANGYDYVQRFTWDCSIAKLAKTLGTLINPSFK